MRIALDATYRVDPHPSGIAVYSGEILDGLAHDHPEDQFLHYYRPKQYRRAEKVESQPVFRNVRRRLLLPFGLPSLPWRKPVLFHALNQRLDARPAKRVVSTFHDLFVMTGEYSSPQFRERFTGQAKAAAANSDLLIAVSDFTKQQIRALLKVAPERIRVVPHGVHAPEQVAEDGSRENILLTVGALQVRKNVLRLVEACEMLPPGLMKSWKLVLAGSTVGYRATEILARIERSRCRERIQLKGYVTQAELENLYRRAKLFAFPSLDEGFGIPVLEAMAHGLPVITSNRSALPQVAGGAAMLVDPFRAEEIAFALEQLMQDDELRAKHRALSIHRAAQFPWKTAVDETYRVYQELLQ